MHKTILYVENKPSDVEHVEYEMARHDIRVLVAKNVEEAIAHVEQSWFHIVVLDVRLKAEDDDADLRGIHLAKDPRLSNVPKIIFTNYPDLGHLQELIGRDHVHAYIGPKNYDELVRQVQRIFQDHVKINPSLEMRWGNTTPEFLAQRIEHTLAADLLRVRAEELQDLFRRLWRQAEQVQHVRFERVLWQHKGRIALVVHVFNPHVSPESFVVVCGTREAIIREAKQVRAIAPPHATTKLLRTAETRHFAANLYLLEGLDLQRARTLHEVYRADYALALKALTNTVGQAKRWEKGHARVQEGAGGLESGLHWLGLPSLVEIKQQLETQRDGMPSHLAELKMDAHLEINPKGIHLTSKTIGSISFLDIPAYLQTLAAPSPYIRFVHVPGRVTGDNLLVDDTGQVWFTDFGYAGDAPEGAFMANLDALIRYDWMDDLVPMNHAPVFQVSDLYQIEREFINPNSPPATLIGPFRLGIYAARKMLKRLWLMDKQLAKDSDPYKLQLLVHAIARMCEALPVQDLTHRELAQLVHLWLGTAMLAETIVEPPPPPPPLPPGITFDPATRKFYVNGLELPIKGKKYDVLKYLYDHANTLCRYDAIGSEVWPGFHPRDSKPGIFIPKEADLDRGNLFTLVTRLKEPIRALDADVEYIENREGGYILTPNPYLK